MATVSNRQLDKAIKHLIDGGIWEPEALYLRVLGAFPRTHYSRIRDSIQRVKSNG